LPLPDDTESLKAMVLAMAAKAASAEKELLDLKIEKASADERIARLTSILKTFLRERHGRKSEKLGSDVEEQQSFVFEEIETGIAAVQALVDRGRDRASKAPRDPRPRKGFAAHLERVEVVIEPEIPTEHQGKDKIKIGEGKADKRMIQRIIRPPNASGWTSFPPASALSSRAVLNTRSGDTTASFRRLRRTTLSPAAFQPRRSWR
jgi:hypothetical protein